MSLIHGRRRPNTGFRGLNPKGHHTRLAAVVRILQAYDVPRQPGWPLRSQQPFQRDIDMTLNPAAIFHRDPNHEGVRRINIYLLRLLYILMFFVLGKQAWTQILTHQGAWEPKSAVVWCVWTAFATLAGSPAEGIASSFSWVILPIVAVPWGYVFGNYLYKATAVGVSRSAIL
jgi:hypothetical protein